MWLFLKLVLAVIVGLLVIVAMGWWLFKRWLKRKVGGYQVAAEILNSDYSEPARIQLEIAQQPQPDAAFQTLWEQLRALGFEALADLEERNGAYRLLRFATLRERPLAAALIATATDPQLTLFAVNVQNHMYAVSNGSEPACSAAGLRWQVDPQLDAAAALGQLDRLLDGMTLRPLSLSLLKAAFEAAYATRKDARLRQVPQRADIEGMARRRRPNANSAEIDAAWSMARSSWLAQLHEALADHYRRSSRVDAVSWQRIESDVHIVHDQLSLSDICELLGAESADEQLAAQWMAAGAGAIESYERLAARLPPAQRRRPLGEVDRPLRAVLYVRDAAATPDAAPPRRPHLYEATDAQGRSVQGSVLAAGSSAAKRQLAEQGLTDVRVLNEFIHSSGADEHMLDPELARHAARATREGIGLGVLRALWSNWLIWAPPALLLAKSLYDGAPYGGGDYAVFGYGLLAVVGLLVLTAPMVCYNQLLHARVNERWGQARLFLALLRRTALMGVPSASQLSNEECKILAASGDLPRALVLWQRLQAQLSPSEYSAGLVAIYDAAGAHDQRIDAQREALRVADAKELNSVDLALALARYQRVVDEPEALLATVSPDGLSELALSGYHYTRGLINAERGMFDLAARQFEQAIERASIFKSNPLVQGMITELHGQLAWALKRAGHVDRAEHLWRIVGPVLESRKASADVVARYREA